MMDIDNLAEGRELDALVWMALNGQRGRMIDQGVFGCRYVDGDVQPHAGYPNGHVSPPRYSTDIAAAWEVVEKLEYNWSLQRDVGKCGDEYETSGDNLYRFIYSAPGMPMQGVRATTGPLAICRAALKAKAGE